MGVGFAPLSFICSDSFTAFSPTVIDVWYTMIHDVTCRRGLR
jgi:hypothetical protein